MNCKIRGLELARRYYEAFGKDMLRHFSSHLDRIAVGLAGEGSECFGYDDVHSHDHDFGPGYCIWIPEELWSEIGTQLQTSYNRLPKHFLGYERKETPQAAGRVGVMTIEQFYKKFTGLPQGPEDNLQWFSIPEHFLATATNGAVFCDHDGTFTKIREKLLAFYPEDVIKKKLAARMAIMAQTGQYNYARCMKRSQCSSAYLTCSEFVKTALSAIYLLNKTYMPFYKWAFRRAEELPLLQDCIVGLKELTLSPDTAANLTYKENLIEKICIEIGSELKRKGWSTAQDDFLQAHGESLMDAIGDPRLAAMHIMVDCR